MCALRKACCKDDIFWQGILIYFIGYYKTVTDAAMIDYSRIYILFWEKMYENRDAGKCE